MFQFWPTHESFRTLLPPSRFNPGGHPEQNTDYVRVLRRLDRRWRALFALSSGQNVHERYRLMRQRHFKRRHLWLLRPSDQEDAHAKDPERVHHPRTSPAFSEARPQEMAFTTSSGT